MYLKMIQKYIIRIPRKCFTTATYVGHHKFSMESWSQVNYRIWNPVHLNGKIDHFFKISVQGHEKYQAQFLS